MRRHLEPARALVLAVVALLVVEGCALAYRPPPESSPHALVLVRVRHHVALGTHLEERVTLDGARLRFARGRTSAVVRVRPGENQLGVHAAYYDERIRPTIAIRNETRTERCTMQADDGTTQSGTCSITVPVPYETIAVDRIDAGGCATSERFVVREGDRYVLEYEIWGPNACRITCERVLRDGRGGRRRVACR